MLIPKLRKDEVDEVSWRLASKLPLDLLKLELLGGVRCGDMGFGQLP